MLNLISTWWKHQDGYIAAAVIHKLKWAFRKCIIWDSPHLPSHDYSTDRYITFSQRSQISFIYRGGKLSTLWHWPMASDLLQVPALGWDKPFSRSTCFILLCIWKGPRKFLCCSERYPIHIDSCENHGATHKAVT